VIDALLEAPGAEEAQGETLAQRAARVAQARGGAPESLAARAARVANARGIRDDQITLGDPAPPTSAPPAPAPPPRFTVRVGTPVGVGVPEETMVRARTGELGLKPAIDATLAMTHMDPAAAASIQRKVNRIRAPGTASTAVNIALSNVASPISPRAADAATDAALERYTEGGGKPGEHADLFGAAAMGGEVAGGLGVGAATSPAAPVVGDVISTAAPRVGAALERSVAGRVVRHAITGAAVNAPLGAATGAIESDAPDLAGKAKDALAGAGHAAAAGAVGGAVMGAASEAVGGALAARAARVAAERELASRGLPEGHSPVLPEPLDPARGVNRPAPSLAAQAVRREVDAIAKADRPAPVVPRGRGVRVLESAPRAAPAPASDEVAASSAPAPAGAPPVADEAELAAAGGERFSGLPVTQRIRTGVRNAFRSAFVTPYAEIEQEAPELAATLNAAGAATKRAQHIADRRLPLALEGLSDEQRQHFGAKLVHDNLAAEAVRKSAAADAVEQDAMGLRQRQQQAEAIAAQAETQARASATQEGRFRGRSNTQADQARRASALADRVAAEREKILGQPGATHASLSQAADAAKETVTDLRGQIRDAQQLHKRAAAQSTRAHEAFVGATSEAESLAAERAALGEPDTPAARRKAAVLDKRRAEASQRADAQFSAWDAAEQQADAHAEMLATVTGQHGKAAAQHAAYREVLARSAGEGDARAKAAAAEALRDAHRADADVAAASRRHADTYGERMVRTAKAVRQQADRKWNEWTEAKRVAQNFEAHAAQLAPRIPAGVEREPWFTAALEKYKRTIEAPLQADALAAGVDPRSLRQPATAYVRLASEQRLDDAEIRQALQAAGVSEPGELAPRSRLGRALIGENPALARYFARNAPGPRQGPLAPGAGASTAPRLGPMRRTAATGSATQATGSAQSYATDLDRIVQMDSHDKAVKAARNRVWEAATKVGRPLEEGESAAPGTKVLSFTDTNGLATGETGVHRLEVSPAVYDAVTRFHEGLEGMPASAAKRFVRGAGSVATRAQISGMPVEATSHMNTLASIVASVPGEKDLAGKALAAVPGQGAKVAAIREMLTLDFTDPATRALENRLADAGALRIETHHGGLINTSHHALFGPEGVDARGRLVLARKLLDRKPDATNEELREFITGKLGNYIKENSGAVTNALQESGISAFARFQAARIPTSIKAAVGESGLPATSAAQRAGDIAATLYRGPVGHVLGANAMNYALTGHSTFTNEKGHDLDVDTGLYAVDGAIKHLSPAEAQQLGDRAAPLYIPGGTLNPVAVGGLRSSGLRALLLSDRGTSGRVADAIRDYTNTGLGVMSPVGRFLFTALTGKVPYVARGGDFMKTVDAGFNKDREQGRRLGAALAQANPAVHAYAETGGGGRTLGQALAHGDAPLGGGAAAAAKSAEFLMPRLLTPGVGGRTNEQSTAARDQREFKDAMTDYTRRVRNANTPRDALALIDEAVEDARSDGRFDPELVRRQLRKALLLGPEPDDDVARLEESAPQRRFIGGKKREIGTVRFQQRVRIRPTSNP
jgi:hypothetical protein